MKVIGYSWAVEKADDEAAEPDEAIIAIARYMRRRKWQGPVQLEDRSEAFVEFHLRPCGGNIIQMLRPRDVLVVADPGYLFSKASQGVSILNLMRERQISLHCVNLGGEIVQAKLFDLIVSILSPLAAAEAKILGERARAVKRRERLEGNYLGGKPPIGFVVNEGRLEADGSRERLIRKILRLKAKGLSLRKISDELRRQGFSISHTAVNSLLQSAGYLADRSK